MSDFSRLTQLLRSLLQRRHIAALGTIGDDGAPLVSMVPYAVEPGFGCMVIHVSDLAAHTRNLHLRRNVSLLVMEAEAAGEPVHALPRVTLDGVATVLLPDSEPWNRCRRAYLMRFPDVDFMTGFPDFKFVSIDVTSARQVAGFGTARSIEGQELRRVLGPEA